MAKALSITTPPMVVTGYTSLQTPTWNFEKTAKEFKTTVSLDAVKHAKMIAQLEQIRDDLFDETLNENPKLKKVLVKADIGREEVDAAGDETGVVTLTFSQASRITPRNGEAFDKVIGLFDSQGVAIRDTVKVGEGSIIKIAFEPFAYYMASTKTVGISFKRMAGVQILKLEEFTGGGSASSMGFGSEDAEEYGFSGANIEPTANQVDGDDADLDDEIPF
jgi:hypothetical protein